MSIQLIFYIVFSVVLRPGLGTVNFALHKSANQSTPHYWNNFYWTADKAVDGNSSGSDPDHSMTCSSTTHTGDVLVNHTWEVDIGFQIIVKTITAYGRSNDIMLKECFQGHEESTAGVVAIACLVYLGLLKLTSREEGIELVRATLETINKLDVLGSLSGDEGSDEEDDDEDEEEEDATQDGSEEDDMKDMEKTINNFVKILCIVQPTDDKTKNIIFECADIMLKECFQGHEESTAGVVANACLVYLGLLKGEDKKYRPPSDYIRTSFCTRTLCAAEIFS